MAAPATTTTTRIAPMRPYDLRMSASGASGGTRRWQGPLLRVALATPAGPARAAVAQRRDGDLDVAVRGPDVAAALDALRFVLATDDDPGPFLRMARRDARLAATADRNRGYRPARLGTVAQAVLQAACGQLVTGQEAARMHRAIVRLAVPVGDDGLADPPDAAALARVPTAAMASTGLAARRATALRRLLMGLDVERLRDVSTLRATARIVREPWLGPWSAGVICTEGLGRWDAPIVGDLGLMRIVAAEQGEWPADPAMTAALVQDYGEWAGLAAQHLLRHPLARRPTGGRAARAA